MYTDGKAIYVWDFVVNTPIKKVLDVADGECVNLAVDTNFRFIFTLQKSADAAFVVNRFKFSVEPPTKDEDGKAVLPALHIDESSKVKVYKGNEISAIALDADQSILYIADTGNKRIATFRYSPELVTMTKSIGKVTNIYDNVSSLDKISSLAVNLYGKLFWTNKANGKTDGTLVSAVADKPDSKSLKVLSDAFDEAFSLYYSYDTLFFVAPSSSESQKTTDTAIYRKKLPGAGGHDRKVV